MARPARAAARRSARPAGFFDTSGPASRGIHHVWFVDGHFAYVSTGAADFIPTNPKDGEFFMAVDLADPAHPREVGRWWYPETRVGDPVPPPPRAPRFDSGYRLHNVDVYPDHPDRASLGYIDGGVVILDISDKALPKPLYVGRYDPPATMGFTHTAMPLFSRRLLVVSAESVYDRCLDAPKRIWVRDLRDERHPAPPAPAPHPANAADLCHRGAGLAPTTSGRAVRGRWPSTPTASW